jgi:hypothetical protein
VIVVKKKELLTIASALLLVSADCGSEIDGESDWKQSEIYDVELRQDEVARYEIHAVITAKHSRRATLRVRATTEADVRTLDGRDFSAITMKLKCDIEQLETGETLTEMSQKEHITREKLSVCIRRATHIPLYARCLLEMHPTPTGTNTERGARTSWRATVLIMPEGIEDLQIDIDVREVPIGPPSRVSPDTPWDSQDCY